MTGTMRVDFYEMGARFQDPLEVVCILVGKAWPDTADIVITGPRPALAELDERLWQRPPGRFLPHAMDGAAPIRLLDTPPAQAGLLINLDAGAPLPEGRYERVVEIVPPDESAKQDLRMRWKSWMAVGCDLHHHKLK